MEKFTLQGVYIGKLEKCELFNLSYLITLAKLHIWQSRKEDKIPQFLKQVKNTLLLKIKQKKNFRLSGYYINGTYI